MIAFIIVVVLHVAAAALAFGAGLGIVGGCRRALSVGQEAFRHAAGEAQRREKLMFIGYMVTLLSGIALIMLRGGMGKVTPNYHAAMGLLILAMALGILVFRPAVQNLEAIAKAPTLDTAAADAAIKKTAMGSGILQLFWTVILVLMFFAW
jgi:hypothetical protein